MKKVYFISLITVFMLVMGHGAASATNNGGDAFEYFPLKTQNVWSYKVSLPNNEAYSQVVLVNNQVGQDIKVVVFINQMPWMEVSYLVNEQGLFRTKQINAEGVENLDPMQMVLVSKLDVGMSWNWEAANNKGTETAKVIGFEKVTVPVGTFEALLIQYEGVYKDGTAFVEKTWFVKGIGYVKVISSVAGQTVTKELIEYKIN